MINPNSFLVVIVWNNPSMLISIQLYRYLDSSQPIMLYVSNRKTIDRQSVQSFLFTYVKKNTTFDANVELLLMEKSELIGLKF